MFKKFIIIIVLFCIVVAGLKLFGGRDFRQVSVAWDKYQYNEDLTGLIKDIGVIFSGDKVSRGGLDVAILAERTIYKWTDEFGTVHHSERMPKGVDYEEIRMGDIKIETQKAMDKEEIKRALKN